MEYDKNTFHYLIHLVFCAISGKQPNEKPENISFHQIFEAAQFHKIANTVFYSIEKLKFKPNIPLYNTWKYIRDESIARDIIQHNEYTIIIKAFTKEKIRILPLKGILLKTLYPKSDMRYMSDLDFLILEKDSHKVKLLMESLGYSCESFLKNNHDVYFKKPYMNVEIHRELIENIFPRFYDYFKDGWKNSIEKSPYLYMYNINDTFIFIMSHIAKHFLNAGTGIRSVIDFYLFYSTYKIDLNMDYLNNEFIKLNISDIFYNFIEISEKWFNNNYNITVNQEFEKRIIYSGIYGTFENKIKSHIKNSGKKNYLISRIFPPYIFMSNQYPLLKKLPLFLPLFWIIRLIQFLIFKRDKLKNELDIFYHY